jgi:hypothetical protein
MLSRLDATLASGIELTERETADLVSFVRTGLLDERALPRRLERSIPQTVPSGQPTLLFESRARRAKRSVRE